MDDKAPRVNTAQIDLQDYQSERKRFLDAQLAFKNGNVAAGEIATTLLTSMYYILPAARHLSKFEEEGKKFVDDLDLLRKDLSMFNNFVLVHDGINIRIHPKYIELDNRFDDMVRQFYNILFKCGFST